MEHLDYRYAFATSLFIYLVSNEQLQNMLIILRLTNCKYGTELSKRERQGDKVMKPVNEQKDDTETFLFRDKMKPLHSYMWQGITWFLVIVACIAFAFLVWRIQDVMHFLNSILSILKPIIVGLIMAYILNPIMKSIENLLYRLDRKNPEDLKTKQKIRSVSVFFTIVLFIVTIAILLYAILPDLVISISNLITDLPRYVNSFSNWISSRSYDQKYDVYIQQILDQTEHIEQWMKTTLSEQLNQIVSTLKDGIMGLFSVLYNFFIGLIISIYILSTKEKFKASSKKVIYAVFPEKTSNTILELARESDRIFLGFLTGKVIDSLIIGVICFVVLSVLQMPYTLIVSVMIGVTNIIPFFGPYIGMIPSTILILLADPKAGLIFLVFMIILQQIDGNLIGPKILGNTTGLSAFGVIFSILLGSGLFGFAGMIFGVPTFAVINHIFKKWINRRIARKNLPINTEQYTEVYRVNNSQLVYPVKAVKKEAEKKEKENRKE